MRKEGSLIEVVNRLRTVAQLFPRRRRRIRARAHAQCMLTTSDKRKDQLGYFVCFKFITKLATLSLHLLGFTFLLSFVPIGCCCLRNKRTSRCGDVMKSLVKSEIGSPTVLRLCMCNGFFVGWFKEQWAPEGYILNPCRRVTRQMRISSGRVSASPDFDYGRLYDLDLAVKWRPSVSFQRWPVAFWLSCNKVILISCSSDELFKTTVMK